MTARQAAAIAGGGALGASARWAVLALLPATTGFPWPVLLVNVVGSALLGVVLAEEWAHPRARLLLHDAGGIGFCGGFTTFSTFALDVARLARDGRGGLAATYVLASVAACLVAVVTTATALRAVRALDLPLEGEP